MSGKAIRASVWVSGILVFGVLAAGAWRLQASRTPSVPTIAFIPQTAGGMLWEVEHLGATEAAEKLRSHLYWNTPTSQSDVAGQVTLIERVTRGSYQGLVVAPNHRFSLLSPLRRAAAAGLPVVVVAAHLDLPPNEKLGYIVNDDDKMGKLAAEYVAKSIGGKGAIALVGITPYAPGVSSRARGAERLLADHFPDIHVVARVGGAYNAQLAEEQTRVALNGHPGLKALLSLTAPSTLGAHAAVKRGPPHEAVTIVGCEQDADLMEYVANGDIAAVIAENTYRMGYEAVGLITAYLKGTPLPAMSVVPPLTITQQNLNSAEVRPFTSFPRTQ